MLRRIVCILSAVGLAVVLGIPVFAKLPIDPAKAAAADAGAFYDTDHSAFEQVVDTLK